jgi:Tfp pilus assembly protein PilO
MGKDFQRFKLPILLAVGALLAADGVMAFYAYHMSSSERSAQQELAAQLTEIKLLKADVARASAIRSAFPATKADCERFKDSLPSARSGYSVITAELGDVGRQANLQIGSLEFHPNEIPARDLTEVLVNATVTGNYRSIMRFVNGVQRSKNYYIVESLSLASDTAGAPGGSGTVRVDLHLKSYFKGTA